jgi:hypothetical protein
MIGIVLAATYVWNFVFNVSKTSFQSLWAVNVLLGAKPMQCFESNSLGA